MSPSRRPRPVSAVNRNTAPAAVAFQGNRPDAGPGGPLRVLTLADWGANVIRVEPPRAGRGEGLGRRNGRTSRTFIATSARSPSTSRPPKATQVFMRLVDRPTWSSRTCGPASKRLGVDYERAGNQPAPRLWQHLRLRPVRPLPPRLVDQIAQGMSGSCRLRVPGQGPIRVGVAVTDWCRGRFWHRAF